MPREATLDRERRTVQRVGHLLHDGNTSAVKKVEKELTEDLRRVRGKTALLFKLAETAVACPDETVRKAVFPVVSEKALRQLVQEGAQTLDEWGGCP